MIPSNFEFLKKDFPVLAKFGELAEKYLYEDSNSCLMKLGMIGEQANDVFEEVRLEDLMTLNNIYNIKGLEDKSIDSETRLQIATVQSMVKRFMYNGDEERVPSIYDYDLLIVDEAHRGYI